MSLLRLPLMLFLLLTIFVGFIIGANIFTSLDDLKQCQTTPTEGVCASADAIVAISGGDTVARTDEAISLYKQGWAPKIILGGAALDPQSPSNASIMRHQALDAGVPAGDILTDDSSENTAENAQNIYAIAQKQNIHNIILVTSPYHQTRASVLFTKTFAGYGLVRNHPAPNDKNWAGIWWISPYNWYLVVGEMVKTIPALGS